jgi:hypothetical protein
MRSAPGGVSRGLCLRGGMSWQVCSSWDDVARTLEGATECAIFCLIPDPGDKEDCPGLGQWTGADVHRASHSGQGSHPPALPKPPHRGPGGTTGLHQPG